MVWKIVRLVGLTLIAVSVAGAFLKVSALFSFYSLLLTLGFFLTFLQVPVKTIYLRDIRAVGSTIQLEVESSEPVKVKVISPTGREFIVEGSGILEFPFDGYGQYTIIVGGREWKGIVAPEKV